MSMPNIQDIKPEIGVSKEQSVDLILASVALEELGLAHMINAEAEMIQFVIGTLEDDSGHTDSSPTLEELLQINRSAEKMMKQVIENEIILDFKLEDAMELMKTTSKEDREIKSLSTSYSTPTYTGSGQNRVGSTTVTLTFTLSDDTQVIKTETFSNINTTTSKDFSYTIDIYDVTVNVTVNVEGENNHMNIVGVTAKITSIVKR